MSNGSTLIIALAFTALATDFVSVAAADEKPSALEMGLSNTTISGSVIANANLAMDGSTFSLSQVPEPSPFKFLSGAAVSWLVYGTAKRRFILRTNRSGQP